MGRRHHADEERKAREQLDRVFKKLDLNQDGVITIEEFIESCLKVRPSNLGDFWESWITLRLVAGRRDHTIVGHVRLRALISGERRVSSAGNEQADAGHTAHAAHAALRRDHLLAVPVAFATATVLFSAATDPTAFAFATASGVHRSGSGTVHAARGSLVESTGGTALLLRLVFYPSATPLFVTVVEALRSL